MNTKLQELGFENNAVVVRGSDRVFAGKANQVIASQSGENALKTLIESVSLKAANDAEKPSLVKTITMVIAAPFIALAYIVALPFIGLYQLAKLALEAYAKTRPEAAVNLAKIRLFAKNVGLFLVSPFIALGYVIALPFVGFYMFTKLVLEVQAKRRQNA